MSEICSFCTGCPSLLGSLLPGHARPLPELGKGVLRPFKIGAGVVGRHRLQPVSFPSGYYQNRSSLDRCNGQARHREYKVTKFLSRKSSDLYYFNCSTSSQVFFQVDSSAHRGFQGATRILTNQLLRRPPGHSGMLINAIKLCPKKTEYATRGQRPFRLPSNRANYHLWTWNRGKIL